MGHKIPATTVGGTYSLPKFQGQPAPAIPVVAVAQVDVTQASVQTSTGPWLGFPSTDLAVIPGHVQLQTGANDFVPNTRLAIDRPFEIKLGVGALNFRTRPFSIDLD